MANSSPGTSNSKEPILQQSVPNALYEPRTIIHYIKLMLLIWMLLVLQVCLYLIYKFVLALHLLKSNKHKAFISSFMCVLLK